MATSPHVSGVKERIIRERNVPPEELAKERSGSMPECFEYIERLKPEDWSDHIAYLYRDDPKTSTWPGAPPAYLDKFVGNIEVRPGYTVAMDDAGAIQQAIKEKFGGRVFRMIVKKGRERITEGRFTNEAPPKFPDANQNYSHQSQPQQASTDASVASKAIDAMASQQPDAVRLAMDVLRSASELVMRQANQPAATPPATPPNSLDDELKRAMIQRFLNPPAQPSALEQLKEFAALKDLFTPPQNSVVDKLVTTALDRFMNPASPAGSGRTTLLDLGREALPVLAGTVKEAMVNWRMGVEAQRDAIAFQRGTNPPVHPQPAQMPPVAEMPATAEAAPSPGGGPPQPPSDQPPFDWLAMKIVEILKEKDYTVDQAVDETLSFLYRSYTPVVSMLLDPPKINAALPAGEQGLLMLFQHHPILKQVPINPRLAEFIKKFFVEAQKAEAERLGTPASTAPAPVPTA